MYIEHSIARFSILTDDSIVAALQKICDNRSGIVFAVSEGGVLEGVMTDGDIRRRLIEQPDIDLNLPVSAAMSKKFTFAHHAAPRREIENLFTDRIQVVPILDQQHRLVSIAVWRKPELKIGPHIVEEGAPAIIVAEIGNNHNGSLDRAISLVDAAKSAGADCVKFQMRQLSELYSNTGNPGDAKEDLGSQYVLDLLNKFSLPNEAMLSVFKYCDEIGIFAFCTPWDEASLAILEQYGMAVYKVASADFTNHDLIEKIVKTEKPIILSTGMSTEDEIREAVRLLKRLGANFMLLHCNSTYPAPYKDVRLNYLNRLRQLGDCPVGYSGHERDINVSIAAVALGAKLIEKHLTIDRALEGNDHKVSLLPEEFQRMVSGIRQVEEALGDQNSRALTQGEVMNREVLAKSLVAYLPIKSGEVITRKAITIKSPGRGLQPNRIDELTGLFAKRDLNPGEFFFESDLQQTEVNPRDNYQFRRPWGLPVRYHDYHQLLKSSRPEFVEFHLSYKDLNEAPRDYIDTPQDVDFVIHCPELFAGDHILNLCAEDKDYRQRSIEELQRVIDLTRAMRDNFPRTENPLIVTNVGGFSMDHHLDQMEIQDCQDRLFQSLNGLETDGIRIVPQTMPPFPWHFGGQRYHNLFLGAEQIVSFCEQSGIQVCLDVSHSKLACNFQGASFDEFLNLVGPHVAHLHIADARGIDGEGLQIGDGEIDFLAMAKIIDKVAPKAGFIPEIWQGHKDSGYGFWVALDRLDNWFAKAREQN